MNELTKTVLELQKVKKGDYEWDCMYTYVYESLLPTTNRMVESFSQVLRGDIHEAHSAAMQQLMKCVESYKYEGYEFHTFYRKSLKNKLVDLSRKLTTKKMQHNTCYAVSLSMDVTDDKGSTYSILERLHDEALHTRDSYSTGEVGSLSQLLEDFSLVDKEKAEVLEILITYSAEGYSKRDMTNALAAYYGSDGYTGTIQRRVSRAREAFKKFALDNGYNHKILSY